METRADALRGAVWTSVHWSRLPVLDDGVLQSIFSVNDKGDKQQPRTQQNGVDHFHQIRKRCTMGGTDDISARQFVATMTHTIRQLQEARKGGEFVVTTYHSFLYTLKRIASHFLATCDASLHDKGVRAAHDALLAEFDAIRDERASYLSARRTERSGACFGGEDQPWTTVVEPLRERLLTAFEENIDAPGRFRSKTWILCQRAAIFACYTLPSTEDPDEVFDGVSAAMYPTRLNWAATLVTSEADVADAQSGSYLVVGEDRVPTKLISFDKVSSDLRWGRRQERKIDGRLQEVLTRWLAVVKRVPDVAGALFVTTRKPAAATPQWMGKELSNIAQQCGGFKLTNTELRKAFAKHITSGEDSRKRKRVEEYARHSTATDDAVYNKRT